MGVQEASGECSMVMACNNGKGKIFPLAEEPLNLLKEEVIAVSITGREMEIKTEQCPENGTRMSPFTCDDCKGSEERDSNCVQLVGDGSPRGVLEESFHLLESDMSSSRTSTSYSDSQSSTTNTSQWRAFFSLWKQKSMNRLSSFPPMRVPKISSWKRGRLRCQSTSNAADLCFLKPSWKNFTLSELRNATNNFSSENLIGKGGYAEVYKGRLNHGQLVAIKRLARGTQADRTGDFLSELGIIAHINHPNAAHLFGFCVEGGLHLVLQLSPHGSLASLLHGSKQKPDWAVRYKVALGTAKGLQYLHDGCPRRIIHRDIKASNILLTEDFEPQISDFGLAKWLPNQWTHHTISHFEGTFGYMAPEYFMHGIVDEKTDVFAFGVLLLELITGRRAVDSSQQSLVMWAKPLLETSNFEELVDPCLMGVYDLEQMKCAVESASLCVQYMPIFRPCMSQVLELLVGEGNMASLEKHPKPSLQRTFSSAELFEVAEGKSYMDDLTRHRKLAFEF
ncbi:hypothetical protein AMTR_s00019p00257180 [Amborella trichopoda]|uniref:non-specific serine/threonine protein kinase n=4 Tax=Amborella trichopoda TaxID=13333 RepID=W1PC40_AMBTC|nr:hypothetical protein AMTR_s00019p00257180 [Amborella trichopoda]